MGKIKFTKEDWEVMEYLDLSLLVCLYSNEAGEPTVIINPPDSINSVFEGKVFKPLSTPKSSHIASDLMEDAATVLVILCCALLLLFVPFLVYLLKLPM